MSTAEMPLMDWRCENGHENSWRFSRCGADCDATIDTGTPVRVYEWQQVLAEAGVTTAAAAAALSIDERDELLSVAAWSGYEDKVWDATLRSLQTESESES